MTDSMDPILGSIARWAAGHEAVRAVVMTGSRGERAGRVDRHSDYDIRLWVSELEPFEDSDKWLEGFGSIMLLWPLKPGSTAGSAGITRLVQYAEGHRIDFQIEETGGVDLQELDNGFRIILDKDGLAADLPEPTFKRFIIRQPFEDEYLETVNSFWWDALYVPKCLVRNQLPFASFMLECQLRHRFVRRMMEWYIGSRNRWSVATGIHGRHLREFLDEETWTRYLSTFSSGSIRDHWRSFFATLLLFRELSVSVADSLGFEYPADTDADASSYCLDIFERN